MNPHTKRGVGVCVLVTVIVGGSMQEDKGFKGSPPGGVGLDRDRS